MLADSLSGIAAQRLCRLLCTHCRMPAAAPYTPEEKLFQQVTHNLPANRAVGCKHCDYTGFRVRLPIVDIVEVSPRLRDAIAQGESRLAALEDVREGGLKSLAASGALRIISGEITVNEVAGAVGPGLWMELSKHFGVICPTDIDLQTQNSVPNAGILLMSPGSALAALIKPMLEAESLRLVVAMTREEAYMQLKKDEQIAFIIGDLPDAISAKDAADFLRKNREHITWARLPAAVLLPASVSRWPIPAILSCHRQADPAATLLTPRPSLPCRHQ